MVIGVVTKTGSAAAVALGGSAAAPRFLARHEIGLVPPGLPAQPYHAAAGRLLAAASECGWPAHAVDQSALPSAEPVLADLGRAAGRPWRRIEKDAARAALTLLPPARW